MLTAGTVLEVAVGGQGATGNFSFGYGGGGSFVASMFQGESFQNVSILAGANPSGDGSVEITELSPK